MPQAIGAGLNVGMLIHEGKDLRVGNGAGHAVAAQDELIARLDRHHLDVGPIADFRSSHELQAQLTAPDTETIGELTRVIAPREPAATALPGYEINQQFALRISFEADAPGGYDLRLRLDDKLQSLTNSLTLSVISR